jgi:hypothetical protein
LTASATAEEIYEEDTAAVPENLSDYLFRETVPLLDSLLPRSIAALFQVPAAAAAESPWICMISLTVIPAALTRGTKSLATALLIPLAWMLLFQISHDREFYFPCTIALAAAVLILPGKIQSRVVHSALLLLIFLVIRDQQLAPPRVLLTEFLSAAVILTGIAASGTATAPTAVIYVQIIASLLACCTLAI